MPMAGTFNANQFEPNQGFTHHPPAQKIPFTVTNTTIKPNKAGDGGFLEVEFTTQLGSINSIYNCWSKTPKAVEIAFGQLSALCRATGRFQLDWQNDGAALRGGTGLLDVGYQKGEEPSPDNPNAKGYTEVKKVYDPAGNDPARSGAQAAPQPQAPQAQPQAQQAPQAAPMTQQPGGGWSNGSAPTQAPAPPQAFQQPPQQPAPAPNGQAWQPGGAPAGQTPPWGQR